MNEKRHLNLVLIELYLLTLLLYACRPTATPAPSVTGTSLPMPSPTCYLEPQPTGEKYIPPNIEPSPPAHLHPGDEISLHYSGGYMIGNNARICGNDNIVGYIHSDELPSYTYPQRTVMVSLEETTLTTVECEYECMIEFVVPDDIPLGAHQLRILASSISHVTFDVEIVAEGTP